MRPPRELRRKWEGILEGEGLPDIDRGHGVSTQSDLQSRRAFHKETKENLETYYAWALRHQEREKFKNFRHQWVWKLHARGMTGSEIGKVMRLCPRRVNALVSSIRRYLKRFERQGLALPQFQSVRDEILWHLRFVDRLSESEIGETLRLTKARVHQLLKRNQLPLR